MPLHGWDTSTVHHNLRDVGERPSQTADPRESNARLIGLLSPYPVEMPAVGDALQFMLAGVFEHEARACHEVLDCRRHEDLGTASEGRHTRADVDGDTANFVGRQLHFPRMHPRPDLEVQWAEPLPDRRRAPNGARRAVESREEAIARGAPLIAAEPA